ncbi:MAG: hypothetical protein QHH13_03265 [Melioribacter sp.]|uniref:hypothetical protein n=1 Tax=Rosettibacter primus TaxID=3111523 RepID=UPI00247EA368|nr:hypothetical protein [Melioribacter sp.]
MKKVIGSCLLVLMVALIFSSTASAQNKQLRIGKIFAKEEANQLFGKPVFSIAVKKDLLKAAVAKADKYILLSIKGKYPVILSGKRLPLLLENNVSLQPNEKAFVFSKEVVEEFLNSSDDPVIYFELRGLYYNSNNMKTPSLESGSTLFTVSNSSNTLEMATTCPPFCDD